ncbi:helix-turn-helix domain-containing protein [Streptomyces luteoverticillatus]|uniref:Helix-turn-helix domain-containing protein n=1 Tax=Streptomyces luteoverticillatus TaxID=66425 RepID=A0A3Q9FVH6_STRLT|nr:helix-turn-helix domain-containing protein [Streptomyces luteoverticillatus]AZQ71915.1 helix-turn-helix domain-containing protein [Streptomyces luteoverticillatus]
MTEAQFSAPVSARTELPRAGVIHIRHRHDTNFTVVGNHLAQHPDLSAVAIGLGVYIQSLPDGASVGIKDLTRRFKEGEITIARALKELETAGYLERKPERTATGRIVTRTRWYERPGAEPTPAPAPAKVDLVKRRPVAQQPVPREEPTPLPPVDQPAADLLAGLRRRDPRLWLSETDVRRLSPAVRTWLDRGIGPGRIALTLTGSLPIGAISWPARLLGYRLRNWLPPALPERPTAPGPTAPLPFQTCGGCERVFRAADPGRCRDCRQMAGQAA